MGWISYDLETRGACTVSDGRGYRFVIINHSTGRPPRLLAPGRSGALWLDERCARGCRVRCDDADGVGWIQTNVSRSFASSSASSTSMRPRDDDDGTRGMRSGSGIDRIKGVSRVGKNPQPGWWFRQFFLVICASECARFGRLTMNHSCVCSRCFRLRSSTCSRGKRRRKPSSRCRCVRKDIARTKRVARRRFRIDGLIFRERRRM